MCSAASSRSGRPHFPAVSHRRLRQLSHGPRGRQAERVAGRVRKHPKRVTAWLLRRLAGPHLQQRGLRQVEVVHLEVKVRPVGILLSWPLRPVVVRHPLEPKDQTIEASQTRKVVVRAVHVRKARGLRVERCQR